MVAQRFWGPVGPVATKTESMLTYQSSLPGAVQGAVRLVARRKDEVSVMTTRQSRIRKVRLLRRIERTIFVIGCIPALGVFLFVAHWPAAFWVCVAIVVPLVASLVVLDREIRGLGETSSWRGGRFHWSAASENESPER